MPESRIFWKSPIVILLFATAGFLLYLPVLGNGFLSDDYDSLFRIYIQKRILFREFLRPMIDISFYFNYLISGLSPWSYYVFNIAIHILNALLVYRFCKGFELFAGKDQHYFALLSGILFLIYPFHNESIVWLSGRLSSMACTCMLACMILITINPEKKSLGLIVILYIVGLLCYESTILLPVILVILMFSKRIPRRKIVYPAALLATSTFFYLLARHILSGGITGTYGNRMVENELKINILSLGKVLGRLFLPGSDNTKLLIVLTIIIISLAILIFTTIFRKKNISTTERINFMSAIVIAFISLLVPAAFGISTKTSEGDRLLYFPSCLICLLLASSILWVCSQSRARILVISIVAVYFILNLELNNQKWVRASQIAGITLEKIRQRGDLQIALINVPDEIDGAFIFRNGLNHALLVRREDTSQIKIFPHLKRDDHLKVSRTISPELRDSIITIFPYTSISNFNGDTFYMKNLQNNSVMAIRKDRNLVYFWNKENWINLY